MLESGVNTMKNHVPLLLDWYTQADPDASCLDPVCLFLEAGGIYGVDRADYDGLKASVSAGGFGHRYTLRCSCEQEDEENYDKMFFLYLELYGTIGSWECDDSDLMIEMVRVRWDEHGVILPASLLLESGETYQITNILARYPMSRRKSDGAGMRYIVRADCEDSGNRGREFALMLTDGGDFIGTWFIEDYTTDRNQVTDLEGYK